MTTELSTPPKARAHYRPEIDGLRAFAVAAVIINHFKKAVLPSGYLGVDIFFVISGYVITLSLLNQEEGSFKNFIASFYARRARRLLPALITLVILSSLLICLVNPNPIESLRTGTASIFGLSNLYLYKQSTDYFSESSELNIFTHTWSLGVEEQFYLFYPILFWLVRKQKRERQAFLDFLLKTVATLSLVSLGIFIYLSIKNQPAAYFLMPSRLWELGSGCLVALSEAKKGRSEPGRSLVPTTLALLIATLILMVPNAFAIFTTPLIIALTVALIRSLQPQTAAYNGLSQASIVRIGLASYSLYLWHWPVLCISRWTIGIQWWTVPIQITLMMAIALASYRCIELPVRYASGDKAISNTLRWGAATCIASAITVSVGIHRISHSLFRIASPPSSLNPLYTAEPYVPERPEINTTRCSNPDLKNIKQALQSCVLMPSGNKNTLYFIGDSQSNHLKAMAGRLHQELGLGSQLLAVSSMPFPTGYYWISDERELVQARKDAKVQQFLAKHALVKARPRDIVVLSGRYTAYFSDSTRIPINQRDLKKQRYSDDGRIISSQIALNDWTRRLDQYVQEAARRKVIVVIMLPFPEFPYSGAQCISYFSKLRQSDRCTQSKQGFVSARNEFVATLERIKTNSTNLYLFDPMPSLCPQADLCTATDPEGKLLYYDPTHVSNYGSRHLATSFSKFLRDNHLL